MSIASELSRLFRDAQASPESIETAVERFVLQTELQALKVVDEFLDVLDRLPLTAAAKASVPWVGIFGDPMVGRTKARIAEIEAKIVELSAPAS